jgi:hypothetical protein
MEDTRIWKYRKGEARMFASPEEVPEGEGWQATPVVDDASEDADEAATTEIDELREQAVALGIKVDGRWSAKKLQGMIAAAESTE